MGKIELIDRFKMLERLQEWNTDDKQDSFLYSFALARIIEQPTVEAIPKADYKNRLKADMAAMLTEIQLEIEECVDGAEGSPQFEQGVTIARVQVVEIIQQKINELKGDNNEQK